MKGRKFLVLLTTTLTVFSFLAAPAVIAQDAESESGAEQELLEKAEKLYDEAVSLYKEADYEGARSKFLRLKEMSVDIGDRKRANVEKYLSRIEDKLRQQAEEKEREAQEAKRKEANNLYRQADNLYRDQKYIEAKQIYARIAQLAVDLGRRKNKVVEERLAGIDELIEKKQAEDKAKADAEARKKAEEENKAKWMSWFERGQELYKAGQYSEAKAVLVKVSESGVDLGRSVERNVASYLEKIEEEEAEAAKRQAVSHLYAAAITSYGERKYAAALEQFREVSRSKYADKELRRAAKKYVDKAEESLAQEEAAHRKAERAAREQADKLYDEAASLYARGDYRAAKNRYLELKGKTTYLSSRRAKRVEDRLAGVDELITKKDAEERAKAEAEANKRAEEKARKDLMASFEEGQKLYKAGRYAEAKPPLEKVRASGVDLGRSVRRTVAAYLERIEEQQTEAARRQAVKDLHTAAVSSYENGRYEAAVEQLREVSRSKYAEKSLRTSAKEYIKKAEEQLAQAEKRQPLIAELREVEALLGQGKYEEALRRADSIAAKGISLGPEYDGTLREYQRLATTKMEEKRAALERAAEQEAARIQTQAQKLKEAEGAFKTAEKLYKEGKLEEARALLQKVHGLGVSLGRKKDTRVVELLDDIDRRLAAARQIEERRAAVMATYRKAVGLFESEEYGRALPLFREVSAADTELDRETKADLNDYIARSQQGLVELEATRKAEARVDQVQDRLAEVSQLVEAGKPEEAKFALDSLLASGLPLSDEHQRQVRHLGAEIAMRMGATRLEGMELPGTGRLGREDRQLRGQISALWQALLEDERIREQERQFRAKRLLEESNQLVEQQQFPQALEKLVDAVELDPELQEAKDKKQLVEDILRVAPAYRPVLIEIRQKEELKRQMDVLEVQNALARARKLYADKQYDSAGALLRQVLRMLDVLPAGVELPQERKEAENLLEKTISEREAAEETLQEQKAVDAAREAERLRQLERERRDKVISDMLKNAFDYHRDGEYERAEMLSGIVLEKDPDNPSAIALRDAATDAIIAHRRKEIDHLAKTSKEELDLQLDAAGIPQAKTLDYPSFTEWEKAGERKPPAIIKQDRPEWDLFQPSPDFPSDYGVKQKPMSFQPSVDRRAVEELLRITVSLEVAEPELEEMERSTIMDVLDEISILTGLNIFLSDTMVYGNAPLADREAPRFFIVETEAGVALELLLDPLGFGYQVVSANTIAIVPKSEAGKLERRVYDVNDVLVNVTNFAMGVDLSPQPREPITLDVLSDWIRTHVAPTTWVVGEVVSSDPHQGQVTIGSIEQVQNWGQLIITQTASVHNEIEQFLQMLRSAVEELMVVSLEITIFTLDESTVKKIGIDWRGIDVAGASPVDPGFVSPRSDVTSDLRAGIGLPISPLSSLDTGGGLAIDYSILRDWQARAFLELVEKHEGTEAFQRPRISLVQNQVSYISLTDQLPYVSGVTSSEAEGTASLTPNMTFASVGVTFSAIATITTDRKYVWLTLSPQFTEVRDFVTATAVSVTGANRTETEITQPILTQTNLGTTAMVPDGGTLVLGGLVRSSRASAETAVPILSKIPILGNFFRSHGKGAGRTTIVIMVTPHIVDYNEYEAEIEQYGRLAPTTPPAPVEPLESVPTSRIAR